MFPVMIKLNSCSGKTYIIRAVSSSDISRNISKVNTWEISVYNLIEHGTLWLLSVKTALHSL